MCCKETTKKGKLGTTQSYEMYINATTSMTWKNIEIKSSQESSCSLDNLLIPQKTI